MARNPKKKKTNSSGPNFKRATYAFSDLVHKHGIRAGKRERKKAELKSFEKAKSALKNRNYVQRMFGVGAKRAFRDRHYHKSPNTLSKITNKRPVKGISSHAILNNKTGTIHSHKLVNEKERSKSLLFYQNRKSFKEQNQSYQKTSAKSPLANKPPAPSKPVPSRPAGPPGGQRKSRTR